MIIDENEKKKEEKNERLLIDLCECYLTLEDEFSSEFLSICIPCLLSAASDKEDSKEAKKEVEIALLALSRIGACHFIHEQYLNEIKEIIQYHQVHRNLTYLAYQSAWRLLIYRILKDDSLEGMIVDATHFVREERKELEELAKSVDWKRKKVGDGEKEAKELLFIERWLNAIYDHLCFCTSWSEEFVELIGRIVGKIQESWYQNSI
ncbi:uncharacterized protein MONOS_16876 [Monocercomonoides exilis]|uniref:uncharacterized protein n=1 Tax=Monocercomonoides exilis TaxID=2049356 RepID=UPI003559B74C|nr:hypothetical protein MONOS_16876 [Monocercomonoides exilis]